MKQIGYIVEETQRRFAILNKLKQQHMNPTSQMITTVINNFEKVLPIANGHSFMLNMNEGRVWQTEDIRCDEKNLCGTPMCHGGWYACATFTKEQIAEIEPGFFDYSDGAKRMAEDLGFRNSGELCDWADQKRIWGNGFGYSMFANSLAFLNTEKRPKGATSLQDIVDHWKEVRERIIELEKDPNYVREKTRQPQTEDLPW